MRANRRWTDVEQLGDLGLAPSVCVHHHDAHPLRLAQLFQRWQQARLEVVDIGARRHREKTVRPQDSTRRRLADAIEVPRWVVHRPDSGPTLPSVGQRLGRYIQPEVRSVRRDETGAQPDPHR